MGRRKRQSTLEELLEFVFDMTGMFWQFGAFVSTVLMFISFTGFDWADEQYAKTLSSPYFGQFAHSYGWVVYLLPIMVAVIAILLGLKSYESYRREHHDL